MRNWIVMGLLALGSVVVAQRRVIVTPDEDVDRVLNIFSEVNERESELPGWRVQILATTDRRQLETTERDFREKYPSILIDWVHNQPYYKLRAGAFFNRREAEQLRQRLTEDYEGVYLVQDDIEEDEIMRMY